MQISNIINLQSGKGRFFCRKMFHKVFWMTNLASLGLVAANIMEQLLSEDRMGASGLAAIGMVQPDLCPLQYSRLRLFRGRCCYLQQINGQRQG